VDGILADGRIVLAAMDICGAMSLKTNYENVHTVFVKRDKRDMLRAIVESDTTSEDKVNRIISIDDEEKNEQLCDAVVDNGDPAEAAERVIELFGL